jgi:glutaredoxin-like protein NrdH
VKEFLSLEGQAYEVRNIEDDDAAYEELMALGARSVPVTVIGDTVIRGFDPVQLRKAVKDAAGGS